MRTLFAAAVLLLLLAAAPADEPKLPGGTVIDTPALIALMAADHPVLIDVAPPLARKPAGLPAGTPWMPPPHYDIPGSIWLPSVGESTLPPQLAAWFQARLAELSGGTGRPLVFYCHIHCKLSLHAAERAIGDGYHRVYWYPLGIEGWTEAGKPTALAKPLRPADRQKTKP